MIVIDASVLVLALVDNTERGIEARRLLADVHAAGPWFAPEHVLLEAAHSIRGLALGGAVARDDLIAAYEALAQFTIMAIPARMILDRVWELSANLTAYDAAYVASAEWLDAPLLTSDRKLAGATGPRCRFEVV